MNANPVNAAMAHQPSCLADLKQIGDTRKHELQRVRQELEEKIRQTKSRNEELRKQRQELTQTLDVVKQKIAAVNLDKAKKARDEARNTVKEMEQYGEQLDAELLMFSIEMQKDFRTFGSGITQMHMEYGKADCMENGVKTVILKADEAKRLIADADRKLLPLQDAVMEAKKVKMIDLDNAKIILTSSEQFLAAKKNALEILKQDIIRMGATPMTKDQLTVTPKRQRKDQVTTTMMDTSNTYAMMMAEEGQSMQTHRVEAIESH